MYNQGYRPTNQAAPTRPVQNAWYAPPPQPQAAKRSRSGSGGQQPTGGTPKKKRSLKWQLIKVLLILVALAGVGVGGYLWKTQSDVKPYVNVFLDNISIDGIDLSGKTWAEGSAAVWAQANAKQNSWYVRLKNEAGEYKDITAATLGISFDPTAALESAWAIGHSADASGRIDVFDMKAAVEDAKQNPREFYSAQQSADTTPIDNILQTLENAAYKAPSDATILSFNPDDTMNPFTFRQEQYGQYLDTSAVREQILQMVHTLQSGEVLIQPTPIQPGVTVSELQHTVSLRYRAVTPIAPSSTESRTNNIRVAFSKINGMVLDDNDKFSFNSVVGRRTEANGFGEAVEYAYGLEVPGIGGGVCQASTTVYLAAIQSGMTITKRSAHSNPVSYTELGMDATVSDTKGHERDFAFRNTSGGKIFISAHVIQSGNSRKSYLCEVRIYGLSLGGTRYELQSETVQTLPKPEEPTLVEDETGENVTYDDEKKKISSGREGYVVDTYLSTITDGVEVSRVKVSTDTYPERADRYWVGVTPRISY